MRYPKFIKPKDTITLIAPSFGAATFPYDLRVKRAIKKFQKLGYNVKCGKNTFLAELPYLSNDPKKIAIEFMENYLDDGSNILISVGGGELQCETLPYIDFDKIKNSEPKWFDGFSDNTNYTFLLTTLCDVASIYGHCMGSFGMYNWHESLIDEYKLLTGEKLNVKGYPKHQYESNRYQQKHPLSGYNLKYEKKIVSQMEKVEMSGRLLGGCLDILILLCGTKYDKVKEFNEKYKNDGVIWFLEACDLTSLAYRRAIFQLREASWFENAKGFIIGRPARAFRDEAFGIDHYNALDILKDLNVPILMDCDLGHLPPSMPFICGAYAHVTYIDNNISIDYELK